MGERLLLDVRKKSHEARSLDRCLDGTLLLGSETASLAADHAAMRVDELFQQIDIFVIDVLNIILSEYICHIILVTLLKRYIVRIDIFLRVIDARAR